jgi:hypothetical protein
MSQRKTKEMMLNPEATMTRAMGKQGTERGQQRRKRATRTRPLPRSRKKRGKSRSNSKSE